MYRSGSCSLAEMRSAGGKGQTTEEDMTNTVNKRRTSHPVLVAISEGKVKMKESLSVGSRCFVQDFVNSSR